MLIYKIEDQLRTAEKLISGALQNPAIIEKLALYQYDKEQVFKAKALLEKVQDYQQQKQKEFANINIETLRNDRKAAYRIYIRHLSIARDVLPNRVGPEYEPKPVVNGKASEAPWLDKAALFYNNIMYSASELMNHGIEKSELEQARAMVEAIRSVGHRMIKNQEELRKLTEDRDRAYNELLHWMFKFKAIAQLVLEDEPDKLAELGFEMES